MAAMKCAYHPEADAVGACVGCGKLICSECVVTLEGKMYCRPCASEVLAKAPAAPPPPPPPTAAAAPPPPPPAPAAAAPPAAAPAEKVSGAWWLLPIFVTWVGGLICWLVLKDRNSRSAKNMLIWGIVLTFVWPIVITIPIVISVACAALTGV